MPFNLTAGAPKEVERTEFRAVVISTNTGGLKMERGLCFHSLSTEIWSLLVFIRTCYLWRINLLHWHRTILGHRNIIQYIIPTEAQRSPKKPKEAQRSLRRPIDGHRSL